MKKKIAFVFQDNKKEAGKGFLAALGCIWLCIEFLSALFGDFKEIIEEKRILIFVLSIVFSVVYGLYKSWPPMSIVKTFKASNTEICIKIGNLLLQPDNIVITTSDYFDTSIPQGQRISLKSQLIDQFFSGNIQVLDTLIDKSLSDQAIVGVYNNLKNGKQYKFPIGTVAVVPVQKNKFFISVLATLTFSNNLKHTSSDPDKLYVALNSLWKQMQIEGRMKQVSVPVLGSGLSGINLSNLMIIESIILSYATHSKANRFSERLSIIIPEEKYDPKDFYEICRFLETIQI